MKVERVMSPDVRACQPSDSCSLAAKIMWDRDCGFVPVTDKSDGRLEGVITDRDICIAAATQHRLAESIPVGEVMNRHTLTCMPSDDVRTAVNRMVEGQVRRLPVVDQDGYLKGVLSLNDLMLAADSRPGAGFITHADAVRVLKAVSAHRLPTPVTAP